MSVSPRGLSVQSAYRQYREGVLLVNRRYQRKLVWTIDEKANLIDSILRGYPIPLILLAEFTTDDGQTKNEIIDGMQRLNAIFDFIENKYAVWGTYFDVSQFPRAQQIAEAGMFEIADGEQLSPRDCVNLLDYELAVTTYPASSNDEITEIFGRINSGGRQLSNQEKRQAGVINPFTELVRQLGAELRGDVSSDVLLLSDMPSISIETAREPQGYRLSADDTDWCKQGILNTKLLRESEDEQMLADIAVSILLDEPFASSKENLDTLYQENSDLYKRVEASLSRYGEEDLFHHIKTTFSVLIKLVEDFSTERNTLRNIVRGGGSRNRNPIKTEFYAIFMALYRLLVLEEKSPDTASTILSTLRDISSRVQSSGHYVTTDDRRRNINTVYGLIEGHFISKEPPIIRHGPGLKLDFVNALRRSKTETPRYEFKQGVLNLSPSNRNLNQNLLNSLPETICAIANLGPTSTGYLFIGIADDENDATTIKRLDSITHINVAGRFVVGIDRECNLLGKTVEEYLELLLNAIRNSGLSEPLKTQILSSVDVFTYEGLSVIRVTIPKQKQPSDVDDELYIRDGTSTRKVTGRQAIAVNDLFQP